MKDKSWRLVVSLRKSIAQFPYKMKSISGFFGPAPKKMTLLR